MGSKPSTLEPEDIRSIREETGFSESQIERLWSRYTSLDKGDNGSLSREDLMAIPELKINPLCDRIVDAFFTEVSTGDRINFRQFIKGLARFRPMKKSQENNLNTKVAKLKFAFKMYDVNGDNKIDHEELLGVLQRLVGRNISDDQLVSIVDRTIHEADGDGDRCISFEEFCKILERSNLEEKMSIRFLH